MRDRNFDVLEEFDHKQNHMLGQLATVIITSFDCINELLRVTMCV